MSKRSHRDDHGMWGVAAAVNDAVDAVAFYLREGFSLSEAEEMAGGGGLLRGIFRNTILAAAKRQAAKPRGYALCACSQHEHKCIVCAGGCGEPAPQEMESTYGEVAKFCRPCGGSASIAGWKLLGADKNG